MSYLAALAAGIFLSRRALADASGVSHTWVNKAICVAELPLVVLECCVAPTQIQPRHAQMIAGALSQDPQGTLERARRLKAEGVLLPSGKLADALVGKVVEAQLSGDLTWRGQQLGSWRLKQGKMLFTLSTEEMTEDAAARVAEAVARAIKARPSHRVRQQTETSGLQLRLDE